MTREEKIRVAAAAIANERGGRRGAPPITNILELLERMDRTKRSNLLQEVLEDAEAALDAVAKAEAG